MPAPDKRSGHRREEDSTLALGAKVGLLVDDRSAAIGGALIGLVGGPLGVAVGGGLGARFGHQASKWIGSQR